MIKNGPTGGVFSRGWSTWPGMSGRRACLGDVMVTSQVSAVYELDANGAEDIDHEDYHMKLTA